MARKISILGQAVFLLGPNVWIFIFHDTGYMECIETSLKYKGVGSDVALTISDNGGQVTYYFLVYVLISNSHFKKDFFIRVKCYWFMH